MQMDERMEDLFGAALWRQYADEYRRKASLYKNTQAGPVLHELSERYLKLADKCEAIGRPGTVVNAARLSSAAIHRPKATFDGNATAASLHQRIRLALRELGGATTVN